MAKKKEVKHVIGDASHPSDMEFIVEERKPENIITSSGMTRTHQKLAPLLTLYALVSLLFGAFLYQFGLTGPAMAAFILGGIGMLQYTPVICVRPSEYNDNSNEKKA